MATPSTRRGRNDSTTTSECATRVTGRHMPTGAHCGGIEGMRPRKDVRIQRRFCDSTSLVRHCGRGRRLVSRSLTDLHTTTSSLCVATSTSNVVPVEHVVGVQDVAVVQPDISNGGDAAEAQASVHRGIAEKVHRNHQSSASKSNVVVGRPTARGAPCVGNGARHGRADPVEIHRERARLEMFTGGGAGHLPIG